MPPEHEGGTERLREIAMDYFEQHPEAKAGVNAAHYAYHARADEPGGHHFGDHWGDPDYRHRPCCWCGRTRWDVRYSEADPRCTGRPDAEGIIRGEEERFIALLERAPETLRRFGPENPTAMTGAELAVFQHTHGLVPETVEYAIEELTGEPHTFSQAVHDEFEEAMNQHRAASAA